MPLIDDWYRRRVPLLGTSSAVAGDEARVSPGGAFGLSSSEFRDWLTLLDNLALASARHTGRGTVDGGGRNILPTFRAGE